MTCSTLHRPRQAEASHRQERSRSFRCPHQFCGYRRFTSKRRDASRGRCGFTLLELLAATAIAAVLLTAVLRVVMLIDRTRSNYSGDVADEPRVPARVLALIEQDLGVASWVRAEINQVTLEGPCGLDRGTLEPAHEPATVSYRLVDPEPGSVREELAATLGGVLIREQRDLLDLGQQRPRRLALLDGVASFGLSSDQGFQRIDSGSQHRPRSLTLVLIDGDTYEFSVATSDLSQGRP